jgi:hypothetical protein
VGRVTVVINCETRAAFHVLSQTRDLRAHLSHGADLGNSILFDSSFHEYFLQKADIFL